MERDIRKKKNFSKNVFTKPFRQQISLRNQKIKIMFHVFPVLCHCLPVSLSASLIACIWRDKLTCFMSFLWGTPKPGNCESPRWRHWSVKKARNFFKSHGSCIREYISSYFIFLHVFYHISFIFPSYFSPLYELTKKIVWIRLINLWLFITI